MAANGKRLLFAGAISASALAIDRLTKAWAEGPLRESTDGALEAIPGVFRFRYAQNTGMAFSALSGKTGFLAVFSAVLLLAITAYLAAAKRVERLLCLGLSCVLAGGAGNLWDRLARGYVTDFIEPTFVRFAVFNAADIFVTVGVILAALSILFGGREKEGRL